MNRAGGHLRMAASLFFELPYWKKGFDMFLGFIRFERLRAAVALLAVLFAICEVGTSQPVLTSIQDMVYLADGSRFNGLAYIEWKSFDAPNGAVIGQYDKVVRIVDGLLQAKLTPTSANKSTYYSVKYVLGGRVLYTEIWAVPQSAAVLKLRDIRAVLLPGGYVSGPGAGSGGNGGGNGGGTGGTGVGSDLAGSFVDGEDPAGLKNGSNQTFTLTGTPTPATALSLYLNGILLSPTVDYTLSTNTLTFINGVAPQSGDLLRAYYRTGSIGSAPHNLLSDTHSDTFAENVQRGDLIIGQGASTRWMRLPLGTANRCLVSNGQDAVWNACLFTGFTTGAVPFVNSSAVLAQDTASFFWDATNKRLGLGTSLPAATLSIQASASQGSAFLTSWRSPTAEVASIAADGSLTVPRIKTKTTPSYAAWNDTGIGADPTFLTNGDVWYNSSQRARKSYEAFQIHAMPQVLQSVIGTSTTAAGTTTIASYTMVPGLFDSGDRMEITFNFDHSGTQRAFTLQILVAGTPVWSRSFPATETYGQLQISGSFAPTGVAGDSTHAKTIWGGTSFGASTAIQGVMGVAPSVSLNAIGLVQIQVTMTGTGTDAVSIPNYTVLRYPAQYNP